MTEDDAQEQGIHVRRPQRLSEPFRGSEGIDRMFEKMMSGFLPGAWMRLLGKPPTWQAITWTPDVDVFKREGKLVLHADLPSMSREEIELEVEDDTLTIRGHRKGTEAVRKENYYRVERSTGEFSRSFHLPEGIDYDAIEATYRDGVLEVAVPRPERKKGSQTKVRVR